MDLTKALLETSLASTLNEEYNIYRDTAGLCYSADKHVQFCLPDLDDAQRNTLLKMLLAKRCIPRYYAAEGEQPVGAEVMPQRIKVAHELRLEEQERQVARDRELRADMARDRAREAERAKMEQARETAKDRALQVEIARDRAREAEQSSMQQTREATKQREYKSEMARRPTLNAEDMRLDQMRHEQIITRTREVGREEVASKRDLHGREMQQRSDVAVQNQRAIDYASRSKEAHSSRLIMQNQQAAEASGNMARQLLKDQEEAHEREVKRNRQFIDRRDQSARQVRQLQIASAAHNVRNVLPD